jgi:mono/diheme cytochrome c family protein
MKSLVLFVALAAVMASGLWTCAQEQASSSTDADGIHGRAPSTAPKAAIHGSADATASTAAKSGSAVAVNDAALRIEGEKRFRTNCGRCHMAPHKFPPRAMATVIRHMRVRAMITDEDMRLILRYMTQ